MSDNIVCENKECGSWENYRCVRAGPILINEHGLCCSYWNKDNPFGVKVD